MTKDDQEVAGMDKDVKLQYYEVAEKLKFREFVEQMPFLKFPKNWEVAIIPPFGGALVRFLVRIKGDENNTISVYFDAHEMLGYYEGKPYWEIYPDEDGDVSRFPLDDKEGLIKGIGRALRASIPR